MVATVNLDVLPLKRVLTIEEAGLEHLPPERTPEEKSRFLLQRIDFEQSEEKDAKRAKSSKESIAQLTTKWPWQGLVEDLQLAQQELSYILDFLTHVEANDAITVTMVKPTQLLHETCSELALRASAKLSNFKKVGKYLKQTAKALEQQVDREAVFYGALMRLQQHWKVKRLRGISAGPGGNAGFTIDLSYPQMSAEMMWGLSVRSAGLYSINVEQDSNGLLMADLPSHCMNTLHMRFTGPYIPHGAIRDEVAEERFFGLSSHDMRTEPENMLREKEAQIVNEKDVGKAVNTGASSAHSILRRIQMAIIHEQIFEWTVREALQPLSGLVVTGVEERSLQLSLGHSCVLVLELLKATENIPDSRNLDTKCAELDGLGTRKSKMEAEDTDPSHDEISPGECNLKEAEHGSPQSRKGCTSFWKDMSAFVCLQQAFYHSAFVHPQEFESSSFPAFKSGQVKGVDGTSLLNKPKDFGDGVWQDALVVEAVSPLKHFSLTMRHRVFSSKVLIELEKLVQGVPYLFLSCHPTWNSRVTSWELMLKIPKSIVQGWKMTMVSWREAQRKRSSKFLLRVVACDALLFVERLEAMQMQDGADSVEWKRSKHRCFLSELSGFLLCQLAGQLVQWLYEEASVMGLNVRRNFLSLFFHINCKDDYVVLASLDPQAYCVNWWLHLRPEGEDDCKEELLSKSQSRRFLGPLNLETLRSILVDLLNYCGEES
eukprot:c14552_g1_i1 orf=388-2532(-)